MSLDLGNELTRLAQSVHDDGAPDRLGGQVHHMVTRIRRRRAARSAATGAVGIGAVAAVAFGGMQLATRTGVLPPAGTPSPSASPTDSPATAFECGRPVGEAMGSAVAAEQVVTFTATLDGVRAVDGVPFASLEVAYEGQVDVLADADLGAVQVVAARDQVVVGEVASLAVPAGATPSSYGAEMALVACDGGDPLPEGSYELYALQEVDSAAAPDLSRVVGGPWVVSIGEPTVTGPTADPEPLPGSGADAGQAALDATVGSPVDNPGLLFPRCGTVAAEALDDGMPPLELDLTGSSLTLASGSTTETTVRLHTTEGLYAIGNASPVATLVVIKDGVVVGYQWLDPEGLVDVDLTFGQSLDFRALGTATLCGTGEGGDGAAVPLPPGEYDVIAALDVMVKEIGTPGGEADGQTYTMTAVSEPGTLTVTED